MENTSFSNPSGMDDENHYSTPLDMARLMACAMKNEHFAEITGAASYTAQGKSFYNHNKLLTTHPDVDGGKTGYTKAAGRTLVSTAMVEGHRLVAVTFNAPNDWSDHRKLYDYARENYTWISLEENLPRIPVVGALTEWLTPTARDQVFFPVKQEERAELVFYLPHLLFAPVSRGQHLGSAALEAEGRIVAEIPLYSPEDIRQLDVLPWHRWLYFGELE